METPNLADADYFLTRAAQHRDQAARCINEANRQLHQRFAEIYERRARDA